MKLLTRLFNPLQRAAAAFFKHDVSLRRGERGVQLVLEQRSAGAQRQRNPSREELVLRKEEQELAVMRRQLGELLDSVPDMRAAMRHLGFVEHALAKKGIRALHKLPLDVLRRALAQLEGTVTNWSPEGLANLRSRMAVALIERERVDCEAEADAYRTSALMGLGPPPGSELPEEEKASGEDDEALAAAYAALGNLAPPAQEGGGLEVASASGGLEMASGNGSLAMTTGSGSLALSTGDGGPESTTGDGWLQMTGELNSPSAKAVLREAARGTGKASTIKLRELQS